jgi:5'(3')-deoxyribonucleotidase
MYSNQKYNDLEKIISNVLNESQGNDMISDYSFPEVTKKIYEQLSLHYTFKEIPNEDKSLRAFMSKEQTKVLLDAFEKKVGKKTLIFDLDGVVADWEPAAIKYAEQLKVSVEEFKEAKLYREIKGFYLSLKLIPGAKEAIMELDKHYDIIFVSAPSWGNIHCFTEKRIWIENHFGEWAEKKMDLSFHKGHYIGHYLVDDRTKYGAGEFIGEHIMFGNDKFPNWDSVLKYLIK